ncbi:MAG: class I SAM-dependent RNA methyltransferase, partial [Candidatus Latescibacteria bacterium]|nr:class I SAM-dependent RNA methyltransferase [Candidatus Latescibacterota bacterium]
MPYDYQEHQHYFGQVADEVIELAEPELQRLGATETNPVYRGIHFKATPEVVYRINYQTRLLTRVLAPLTSFNCHSDKYLYRKVYEIAWEDFLDPTKTFAVFATVAHSHIKHSKYAALKLKDAVVDYIRDRTGERPSIDTRDPDLWINLHIENNFATVSV